MIISKVNVKYNKNIIHKVLIIFMKKKGKKKSTKNSLSTINKKQYDLCTIYNSYIYKVYIRSTVCVLYNRETDYKLGHLKNILLNKKMTPTLTLTHDRNDY